MSGSTLLEFQARNYALAIEPAPFQMTSFSQGENLTISVGFAAYDLPERAPATQARNILD